MFQFFQNTSVVTLVGVVAVLVLSIGCSAPAPTATSTPLPTYTPYPTATPRPTYTPFPTPTPEPTAIPTATPEPTTTPTPTAVPTSTPTLVPEPIATSTPTSEPSNGNWILMKDTDPITDSESTSIWLRATESTSGFPYEDPLIFVGCQIPPLGDVIWHAIVISEEYLGLDDPIVDWRVNGESALTSTWQLAGDNAIISPDAKQIVSDLLRADKITARVYRDFAESITAVWHPVGFSEAYKPVEEACGQ